MNKKKPKQNWYIESIITSLLFFAAIMREVTNFTNRLFSLGLVYGSLGLFYGWYTNG